MASFTYHPAVVFIESTGDLAIGATGVLRPEAGGNPVQVYDLNGSPIPSVSVGSKGVHQPFQADIPDGVLDFGSVMLVAISKEALTAAITAQEMALETQSELDDLQTQVTTLSGSVASANHTHPVTALQTTGVRSVSTVLHGDGVWRTAATGGSGGVGFLVGGSATSTFSNVIFDGGTALA